MPYERMIITRRAVADDEAFRDRPGWGESHELEIELAIHSNSSGTLIVNYPGYNGDIAGYNNKYEKIADMLQQRNVGAVVRIPNDHFVGFDYRKSVQENLRCVVDYTLESGERICGSRTPRLYIMGFSSGASAIAAICADYEQLDKILLVAPSGDAGKEAVEKGLSRYLGEVYVTIGENDEVVRPQSGQMFYDLATAARKRELVVVPHCDHQFRGEINGKIMSKAPLWAFTSDETYPSPEGGIVLYE